MPFVKINGMPGIADQKDFDLLYGQLFLALSAIPELKMENHSHLGLFVPVMIGQGNVIFVQIYMWPKPERTLEVKKLASRAVCSVISEFLRERRCLVPELDAYVYDIDPDKMANFSVPPEPE